MKRLLFVVNNEPALLELLPIVERAPELGLEPAFCLHGTISARGHARIEATGHSLLEPRAPAQPDALGLPARAARKLELIWRGAIYKLPRIGQSHLVGWLDHALTQLAACRELLRTERVAALVLTGDRHLGREASLVKAANEAGIPSLISPYALSDPDSDALSRGHLEVRRATRALALARPNWTHTYEGRSLFFERPDVMLAAAAIGVLPDRPWSIGGGHASRMAVENEPSRRARMAEGVPPEKLVVTGRPSLDSLARASAPERTRALRDAYGVRPGERLLLCAVPQLGEHGLLPWPRHWEEVERLLRAFAGLEGVQTVLSLHPKSDPTEYLPRAARFGAQLASERVYELLPACDLFVATFSSTVIQAAALGKPTVVAGYQGIDSDMCEGLDTVEVVREAPLLSASLARALERGPGKMRDDLALLDGRCTERVLDELRVLLSGS